MQGYKEPSFQDRVALARSAKNKALAQLLRREPLDPAEQSRRIANQAAKDEALQTKRHLAAAAKEAATAAKLAEEADQHERDRVAAETAIAAQPRILSETELKIARDVRYAARKARKSRKSS